VGRLAKSAKGLVLRHENVTSFSPGAVRDQLQRILGSPDFEATRQQRALLNFVVSETLAGNSSHIKGYAIATRVFGRGEDFNQAVDPIVSVQASGLRRALERYYLLAGKGDSIRIDVPTGGYVPVFRDRKQVVVQQPSLRGSDEDTCFGGAWPTVLIKPFQNLTGQPERNFWGAGFATELALEINRYQRVCVLRHGEEGQGRRAADVGARFIVEGSIRDDDDRIKVVVSLVDGASDSQVWSDSLLFKGSVAQIVTFQEEVAAIIGAKIAGEQGIITKTLFIESRDKLTTQLKTYEAILRYHEYDRTLAPDDFARAFEALEDARTRDPECGQVWSFLGRLYANIYSLEVPGFDVGEAGRKALEYAEKGVTLNPENQGARGILALVRLLSDDLDAARRDVDIAYHLNPRSLYLMDGIGYIKTLLGDWEEGPALIKKVIKLNPYYLPVVHYALWVDYLRQKDFEKAYMETKELRRPAVFWQPLVKACTLGLLGRIEEGKEAAAALVELKPDFRERGRVLIGRYVKFEDIAARVIRGLAKVGVKVV